MQSTQKNTIMLAVLSLAGLSLTTAGCGRTYEQSANNVRYTPDGQILVSLPGQIRVYDTDAAHQVRTVHLKTTSLVHDQAPWCTTVSKDGTTCAAVGNLTFEIYRTDTGALIRSIPVPIANGEGATGFGLALSADGALLAAAVTTATPQGTNPTQRRAVWRVADGQMITAITDIAAPGAWGTNLVFSPDGGTLYGSELTPAEDAAYLTAWDTTDGHVTWRATMPDPGHPRARPFITALALSADGTSVATGGFTANLWRAADGTHEDQFVSHLVPTAFRTLAFSPNGQVLVGTTGEDVLVDPVMLGMDGSIVDTWQVGTNGCTDALFSPDGSRIASLCGGLLKVWNATTGVLIHEQNVTIQIPK